MSQNNKKNVDDINVAEIEVIPPGHATDLQVIEGLTPTVIFSEGGSRILIDKIKAEVSNIVDDIATKEGRDAVAARAYKVARSKTLLDNIGKKLNEGIKKQAKVIDTQRAMIWDELEALQKDIRAPLTEWETTEKARTDGHTAALQALENLGKFDNPPSTELLVNRIETLIMLSERDWEEHAELAQQTVKIIRADLDIRLSASAKADAEREELERLRQQAVEREAEDKRRAEEAAAAERKRLHDEDVKKASQEAADKARQEEAAKLQKAEADKKTAEEATKKAHEDAEARRVKDKEEADRRAAAAAEEATKKEQDRQAAEAKKVEDERLKREANRAHCAKINNAALEAVVTAGGVTTDQAKAIVEAIVLEKIPHIKITY